MTRCDIYIFTTEGFGFFTITSVFHLHYSSRFIKFTTYCNRVLWAFVDYHSIRCFIVIYKFTYNNIRFFVYRI